MLIPDSKTSRKETKQVRTEIRAAAAQQQSLIRIGNIQIQISRLLILSKILLSTVDWFNGLLPFLKHQLQTLNFYLVSSTTAIDRSYLKTNPTDFSSLSAINYFSVVLLFTFVLSLVLLCTMVGRWDFPLLSSPLLLTSLPLHTSNLPRC